MINVEQKLADNLTLANYGWGGQVINCCAIPQSDLHTGRDGTSIKLQNLTYRYIAKYNTADTTDLVQYVRVIFFRAKHENDIDITVNDVLETVGTQDTVLSPKNYTKRFKTKILYDQLHPLYNPSNGCGPCAKYASGVIRLNGHIEFDPNQADGTDIENGGLYALITSDQSTNAPSVRMYTRVTFTDN